jgi:hypothetical protein
MSAAQKPDTGGSASEGGEITLISCPKCGQRLSVPVNLGDLRVTCTKCRHCWEWSAPLRAWQKRAETPVTEQGDIGNAFQTFVETFLAPGFAGLLGLGALWGSLSVFLGRSKEKDPNTVAFVLFVIGIGLISASIWLFRVVREAKTAEQKKLDDERLAREERERPERLRREQEEERQRKQAEEATARAKWTCYHEAKSMDEIARMSGAQFEEFLARLFAKIGYTDICLTPTNDQGADLLCLSPIGKKVAVQAKRWAGGVGNGAVQEVLGAMTFYGCCQGIVITNSVFTDSARELAKKAEITLYDGRWLAEKIRTVFPVEIPAFSWDEYNKLVKDYRPSASRSAKKSGRYRKRRWH